MVFIMKIQLQFYRIKENSYTCYSFRYIYIYVYIYLFIFISLGIVCYHKLEDMTKLVSSQVVRKDNKYVVQKYMGKSRSVPDSQS